MTDSGASFSVATTIFVSLAICAVISYGIFYYFKQRIAVIEQSQMEQARIMQAIISRGLLQQQSQSQQSQSQQQPQAHGQAWHKEITITQNGLIEVSSESESESEFDSDSDDSSSSSSSTSSSSSDVSDSEIHALDQCQDQCQDQRQDQDQLQGTKHIHIDIIDSIDLDSVEDANQTNINNPNQTKKIISLNKNALADDSSDGGDDDDDSSSSEDQGQDQDQDQEDQDQGQGKAAFELKIGYKHKKEPLHLNYGNMSVPALRQMAKERGLVGEDADLQKLKKKDLVQLLQ